MGDRAVIATENKDLGVYLHWNGDRNNINGFLIYCKMQGFRAPETDNYGWARLTQIIANFFVCNGLSVGVDKYENLDTDNWNNGTYIIKDWEIIGREFFEGEEEDDRDLIGILIAIDKMQPPHMQLGVEKIEQYLATNK